MKIFSFIIVGGNAKALLTTFHEPKLGQEIILSSLGLVPFREHEGFAIGCYKLVENLKPEEITDFYISRLCPVFRVHKV